MRTDDDQHPVDLIVAARSVEEPRTAGERVYRRLRDAILEGDLKPGQRLLIENLAADLGTSTMPVREALRALERVGFVEHVPHVETRVRELSLSDLRDVYRARLGLEPLAVALAAKSFSASDVSIAAMRLAEYSDAVQQEDEARGWAAHTAFHFALYEASRSRWLVQLIEPLWETMERYRRVDEVRGCLAHREAEHHRILAACIEHDDSLASALLHDHLAFTANQFAEVVGSPPLFVLQASPAPCGSVNPTMRS
jgi:DNA-binding GntR family transcriptional regulator